MALLLGLVQQEPARVADVLTDWSGDGAVDHEALVAEIEAFVEQYRGLPLRQLKLAALLSDVVAILRHHQKRHHRCLGWRPSALECDLVWPCQAKDRLRCR